MLDTLASMGERLDGGSGSSVWALSEADLLASLEAAHALRQRLAGLTLALVREVDGRGLAA